MKCPKIAQVSLASSQRLPSLLPNWYSLPVLFHLLFICRMCAFFSFAVFPACVSVFSLFVRDEKLHLLHFCVSSFLLCLLLKFSLALQYNLDVTIFSLPYEKQPSRGALVNRCSKKLCR